MKNHWITIFVLFGLLITTGCQMPFMSPLASEDNLNYSLKDKSLLSSGEVADMFQFSVEEFDLKQSQLPEPHRYRVNDSFRMFVWGHPELTYVATVHNNGMVSLPLIGEIYITGKTSKEIEEVVTQQLIGEPKTEPIRLKRNDQIRMLVWHHPDLTYIGQIQLDGYLTLPVIGEIEAAGKTVTEVREEVVDKFSNHIQEPIVSILPGASESSVIPNARVSILPESIQSGRVIVMGEVAIKGPVPISGQLRAVEAISSAQVLDTASLNSVIVIRNHNNKSIQYQKLRLKDYLNAKAPGQNIYLRSDDVIFVPPTFIAEVGKFVEQWFSRTRPVFDWWIGLHNAREARDIARSTVEINDLILRTNQ